MNEWIHQYMPDNYDVLAHFDVLTGALVVNLVLVVAILIAATVHRRRTVRLVTDSLPPGEGLAELAAADDAPGVVTQIDSSFNRIIERSVYPLTVAQAAGVILLVALLAALVTVLLNAPDWAALLAFAVGMAVPIAVLVAMHRYWQREIEHELPDCVYLLQQSVKSGLTLTQAIADYVANVPGALSRELQLAVQRMNMGIPIVQSLRGVAHRLAMPQFDVFVSVISLQSTTGGDLPFLLEQVASSIRARNQFRGYVRSASAMGRLSAIAMVIAYPAIFVIYFFVEKTYLESFFNSTQGWVLFGISLLLEVIGACWLWSLLRVEE